MEATQAITPQSTSLDRQRWLSEAIPFLSCFTVTPSRILRFCCPPYCLALQISIQPCGPSKLADREGRWRLPDTLFCFRADGVFHVRGLVRQLRVGATWRDSLPERLKILFAGFVLLAIGLRLRLTFAARYF